MSFDVRALIKEQIKEEGEYSDDPKDRGGKTKYGITENVARAFGYEGAMIDLSYQTAFDILLERYYIQPKFDQVTEINWRVGKKLTEVGINMGQSRGGAFLQRALNVLNQEGNTYPDISVDGAVGKMTLHCLKTYLGKRGKQGETVLLRLLNGQQGVKYMEFSEAERSQERFTYGWVSNRVDGEFP